MAQSNTKTQPKQSQESGQGSSKGTLVKEATAALKRLQSKDPGLRQFLQNAHAYAVFPNVGKAALVVGGAYGRGVVFQKGQPIGFATIGQLTLGVQIGGDTYSELVVFESRESLERFKKGKTAFSAGASAVLVKAGAAANTGFEKGVAVFAYPLGGMLLEVSIGGQKFKFKPSSQQGSSQQGSQGSQSQEGEQEGQEGEDDAQEGEEGGNGLLSKVTGGLGSLGSGLGNLTSRTTDLVKQRPVAAALIGTGIVAGLALAAIRAFRSGGSGESEESEEGSEEGADEEGSDGEESSENETASSGGRSSRWS